jgi:small subunit ribosomal protein S13
MRISGINIPDQKRLEIGLTALFGIGRARSLKILEKAGVDHNERAINLTDKQENKLRELIEEFRTEGDLRRDTSDNIKRLRDIQSYRGTRHNKRLPVHGQRTKTNSRTARGNVRKTMASGKRKLEKK